MAETIIISNLHQDDFVASPKSQLSVANHIKLAILNLEPPPGEPEYAHNILHWLELAFLRRIIIIFKSVKAASRAFDFLQSLQADLAPAGASAPSLALPPSVKLSLQENLLLRSRLSDGLGEASELGVREDLERFRSKHSLRLDGYHEPEPEKLDMYQDLLKSGIDISDFNSDADVKEFELHSKQGDAASLGRSRSVTKTLFKPSSPLLAAEDPKASSHGSGPPPSPIITLDETF